MNRAIYIHAGGGYDRFQKELLWAEKAGFRAVGIEVGRIGMDEGGYDVIRRCRALLDEKGMLCTQTHLDCYDPLLCSTVVKADIEESIRRGVELSAILGAPSAVYHPRTAISKGYDWRISYEHNREALKPLLELQYFPFGECF